ncbi:MAG: acetolactate synthase large subunit [Pseudomonadota bacterium]
MKASDLFVQALESEGVVYVFGIPGEENIDLLESIRTSSQLKLILTRHEQAAGFMAATMGRLTGRTGVALSTLGPGATNFVTAAAYAQLGAMPVLFITGQKPVRKSKQGQFQVIDSVAMFTPLTKYARQIVSGNNVAVRVREAFKQAERERPGAVHLELPEDIAAEQVADEDAETLPAVNNRRPIAEEKAIYVAVEMISAARKPVLVVGAGSNRKQASKMLTKFVSLFGIPFIPTQMGKGVIDERHASYVGTAALSANDYIHAAVDDADLIINVGHDVIEKPPFIMRHHDQRRVLHINFSPAAVDEVYFPHHEVVGDIANAIWQINQQLVPQDHWDFSAFQKARELTTTHTQVNADASNSPLFPQRIVHDVRDALGDDDIIALDNGMYKLWFSRYYRAHRPNTVLLDNALATMGAGLPSAIAAKLVHPERQVVAVVGDGGFMMNSQELETAVRLKLHLIVLLINDNAFGMIKWKQADHGFPNFGMDCSNPDFVQYARSYGAHGYRVDQADDLSRFLSATLAAGEGVHLIEVPVDYSENTRVFSEELKLGQTKH